jgi:hypothetical protein
MVNANGCDKMRMPALVRAAEYLLQCNIRATPDKSTKPAPTVGRTNSGGQINVVARDECFAGK